MGTRYVVCTLVLLVGCASEEGRIDQQRASLLGDVCLVLFEDKALAEGMAEQVVEADGADLLHYLDGVGIGLVDGCSLLSTDDPFISGMTSPYLAASPGLLPQAVPSPSGPTPADIYYKYQWDIRRVKADQVWPRTSGSHGSVVAIIDTGVAYNHPDLAPNVIDNQCFDMPNLVIGTPCNPYPRYNWHGTAMAGVVAAAFGGGPLVGVGPNLGLANYNVSELVNGQVVFTPYAIFAALWDAANKGYDAANLSFAFQSNKPLGWNDPTMRVMLNRVAAFSAKKGLTLVAAAGNLATSLNGPATATPAEVSGVIAVGATAIRPLGAYPQPNARDILAGYSNYGAAIDLVAPGGDYGPPGTPMPLPGINYAVGSTGVQANPVCAASASCPVGDVWLAGTSMAAPHVAAAVGLMRELNPKLSPKQIAAKLKKTAAPLGKKQLFGHGMLDVAAATAD